MATPDTVRSGRESGLATTQGHKTTRKPSSRNGGQGRGQCGVGGRGSYQGRAGRGRRFNHPAYASLISNFKREVHDSGTVLGNTGNKREAKDQ